MAGRHRAASDSERMRQRRLESGMEDLRQGAGGRALGRSGGDREFREMVSG
jgi:hypothetical protein